jgi:uncharacterized cupredoxin-like copper-binding protein
VRFLMTNRDPITHEFVLGDTVQQAEHEKEMASMPGMPMDDPNGVTLAPGHTGSLARIFISAANSNTLATCLVITRKAWSCT